MDYHELTKHARAAKKHSFSPYSRFRVGAAVLTRTGKIFSGCNVENSSYGLTICAERTALFKAISEGERHFVALAIAGDRKGYIPPCGACRQVILDLAGEIDIVLTTPAGKMKLMKTSQLIPVPFGAKNLTKRKR